MKRKNRTKIIIIRQGAKAAAFCPGQSICKAVPTLFPTSFENQDLRRKSTVTTEENGEWKGHVRYSL